MRKSASVSIPGEELLRHTGETGWIRPWRIAERAGLGTSEESSSYLPRVWRQLRRAKLVHAIEIGGTPLRWHWQSARGRDLLELTPDGRQRYRLLSHGEPAPSEAAWVLREHSAPRHALAILEARDTLLAMGIPVDDDPPACPQVAADPGGPRSEPDLLAYYQERVFPVEVQRAVGQSLLPKWIKSLALYQRLMLITFTEHSLNRQGSHLRLARERGQLQEGRVLLASLERFERGLRSFTQL